MKFVLFCCDSFLLVSFANKSFAGPFKYRTVALTGRPAPGAPLGVYFGSLNVPVINNSGQTAFLGSLTGTGVVSTNNGGIWSDGNGAALRLVARAGDPATGTPAGVNFSELRSPLLK